MRSIIFTILIILSIDNIYSQAIHLDVGVSGSLLFNGSTLKASQEKTNDELNTLNKKQTAVAVIMTKINQTQEIVYKGLSEVNSVVKDGLALKRCYKNVQNILTYSDQAVKLAKKNPHYLLLTNNVIDRVKKHSIEIYTDIATLLTGGKKTLMNTGQRKMLIDGIERNTYQILISVIMLKNKLLRIDRVGFLNSLNPFNSYVNQDLILFNQIITNSGQFKD